MGREAHAAKGAMPLHQRLDALIQEQAIGPAAPRASDGEFLRRVYLDLVGYAPPWEQTVAFLADEADEKRASLIRELLDSDAFSRHMVDVFDVMFMERRRKKYVEEADWREFLYSSLAARQPLNEMFAEILRAEGTQDHRGPARFLLDREANPHGVTRDIGRVYFGRDLQCAQCHDHPLIEDYYQSDYYGILAFVTRSHLFTDKKNDNQILLAEKAEGEAEFQSVFEEAAARHAVPKLPGRAPLEEPRLASDERYEIPPAKDVRAIPRF